MTRQQQLVQENLGIAAAITKRVTGLRDQSDPRWEDAYGVACIELCRAANDYDPAKGTQFVTLAWPRVQRAVERFNFRMLRHWRTHRGVDLGAGSPNDVDEDRRRHGQQGDYVEFRAALSESPEDLMIAAEAQRSGRARLERLSPEDRADVERLLDREFQKRERVDPRALAEKAGVRLPAQGAEPKRRLTAVERTRRWWKRLTPAEREARRAKERAWYAARKARRAA